MKKIIITGASGFIGRNLLENFDFSDFEITLISRNISKIEYFNKNFNLIQADLTDLSSLNMAFQGQDILINLAAEVRDNSKLIDTNILGTNNCIEAIKNSSIKKVIHLSSVGVVGQNYNRKKTSIDEKFSPSPSNEYERTKLISENLFCLASKENGFNLVIFRPTNVFVEYHPFNALLNLMQRIQQNKILVYEKEAVVNYIYVNDLAQIIFDSISNDVFKGIINTGKSMLIKDFYLLLKNKLNSKSKLVELPNFGFQMLNNLQINKLNSVSNHTIYEDSKLKSFVFYKFGIDLGIVKTIEFYKLNNKLK